MSSFVSLTGGCHCGAVRFTAKVDQAREVLDCNCSICSRTGYLHVFVSHGDFVLERGKDALISYRFGSGEAEHLFCRHCGIKSFYQPRSHPECYSVHLKCIDDVKGWEPTIVKFDGQNWDESARQL